MNNHPVRPAIPPLTSLRFFAASLVVIYHYDANRLTRLPEFVRSWLETGYEAVTFFFLLSGFVLAYVYHRTAADPPGSAIPSLRTFFAARFSRLAPAYYLALLVALPIFVVPSLLLEDERASPRLLLDGFLVLTGLQAWWPPAAFAWNPPAWSISVELFMYATFPLILATARRIPTGRLLVGSYVLVVAMAMFRVTLVKDPPGIDSEVWYNATHLFPLLHLPQFIFGVALGRAHLEGPRLPPGIAAWMFAAGIVGLMIMLFELEGLPLRIRSNAILVILFSLIIYGAAQPGHAAWRVLSLSPLVYLGSISYSIYALHQPLEFWWEWVASLEIGTPLPPILDFLLFFAIVLALSALAYRYVEVPLGRRLRAWGTEKTKM